MSTEQIPIPLPFVGSKKVTIQHPIGPLTASEISQSSSLIKSVWPSSTNIQFKVITLQEPKKAELAPFLTAERTGVSSASLDRRSFVVYYIRNTVSTINECRDDAWRAVADDDSRTNSMKLLST